jgi:hypothetical protein
MTRRGLLGMMAALALAAVLGLRAGAMETKTEAGCACCGSTCACPACTCDAKAESGRACDCCGTAACCSETAATAIAACCQ